MEFKQALRRGRVNLLRVNALFGVYDVRKPIELS